MKDKNGNAAGALFQYRPPAAWAFENLCCGNIYFRSPLGFNDPIDCRTPPVLRRLTDEQLAFLRRTNPDVWGIAADNKGVSKAEFVEKINEKLLSIHDEEIRKCGIACFSKRGDDPLMWAHYAGGGRGFCLEFDNGGDLYESYDVDYSGKFPDAYRYVEALAKWQEIVPYPELLLTHKDEVWQYEEEVRMFRGGVGKLSYPAKTLKAVYFGIAATEDTKTLVRTVIKDKKYRHVRLWQGKPGKDKKVKFTPLR